MSSDYKTLAALAMKTNAAMRYFELVTVVNGDLKKLCYCGLGKHSMFFLRLNWDGPIFREGAEVPYAYILKVVEDRDSSDQFMIFLSENRQACWTSERVYITSEQRVMFLRHLRIGYQTDYMWRLGRVKEMAISVYPLRGEKAASDIPDVQPFQDWIWREYQDYKFMVPVRFREEENNIQLKGTGEFKDNESGTGLVIQVHEMMTLDQAKFLGRDNIRWVALAYRESLLRDVTQFYVTRNCQYQKKMNFVGDVASWSAWEICIRTEEVTLICVLLRRQYVPPVCCCLQDIAVIFRCPADSVKDRETLRFRMNEARLVADTLCSTATRFTVYRPVVMSKLDALQFDDQGISWVRAYLKITPKWRRQAKRFLRKIIGIYIEDQAMPPGCEGMLDAKPIEVIVNADPSENWNDLPEIKDMYEFLKAIREGNDELRHFPDNAGLPDEYEVPEDFVREGQEKFLNILWKEECEKTMNGWNFRMARYLAWALDGGILGARFTLDTLLQGVPSLSDHNRKVIMMVLSFLLHLRIRDVRFRYEEKNLKQALQGIEKFDNSLPLNKPESLDAYTFNESVMMTLLQSDYMRRSVFLETQKKEYYALLGRFLKENCNVDFKAFVCRQIMETGKSGLSSEIVSFIAEPVLSVIESGNIFLSIYAFATLVNLTHGDDIAKANLIAAGIGSLACKCLRAKDDELVAYTLMLLVNLTKEPSHRNVLADAGLISACYDILTSTYEFSIPPGKDSPTPGSNDVKVKVLTQLCVVIGQFCNEEIYRRMYSTDLEYTVMCLVFIVMNARRFSALASKAMFALKQVAVDAESKKLYISTYCSKKVIEDLLDTKEEKSLDFYNQAVLFLTLLANNTDCQQRLHACGLTSEVLENLMGDKTNKVLQAARDTQQRLLELQSMMEYMERHGFQ